MVVNECRRTVLVTEHVYDVLTGVHRLRIRGEFSSLLQPGTALQPL